MTETRYRTSHPLLIATPALQAWADEHGAHWLIDAVASHLFAGRDARRAQADPITFWTVTVRDDATEREPMAVLRGTDGGVIDQPEVVYAQQEIDYTDLPAGSHRIYVARDGRKWVAMLPEDY